MGFIVALVISFIIVYLVRSSAFRGSNSDAFIVDIILAFVIALFISSC